MENVTQAIKDSCNIFFYDAGRRTTIKVLQEYAQKFGLGEYTGIEIPESKGRMAGPETNAAFNLPWYDGDTMPPSARGTAPSPPSSWPTTWPPW